jgi:hypothetical protein
MQCAQNFSVCQNRADIYPQRVGKDGLRWQQHLTLSERDGRVAGVSDPTGQIEAGSVNWELLESICNRSQTGWVPELQGPQRHWRVGVCCTVHPSSPHTVNQSRHCSANLSTRYTRIITKDLSGAVAPSAARDASQPAIESVGCLKLEPRQQGHPIPRILGEGCGGVDGCEDRAY